MHTLRQLRDGPDVLEPRHASWFDPQVDAFLARARIARVAADPPRAETDGMPGGSDELAYFRLHGQPRTYYSAYRARGLEVWAARIRTVAARVPETWCVFDNTAAGEGTGDALALRDIMTREG